MFRKSKNKIVISIMVIMTLLIAGTMAIIYFSSYREMTGKDDRMLEHYVQVHDREHSKAGKINHKKDMPPPLPEDERAYGIATIYSVSFDQENHIVNIDNNKESITNDELTKLAKSVLKSDMEKGKIDGYNYIIKKNKYKTLVAFMDCSNFEKSINTLLKYTIVFGIISLIVIFVISIILADKIIQPLEKNYNMQKQFISDAGHELKTPVTVISTNAEVLAEEIGENKWLENINYENEKMSLLIKQLLELTRTEQNEIKLSRVDFSRLILGEILPFESVAFEKGMEIVYEKIAHNIYVNGNASQLGQLASILMDNAIEHSTGEKITVTLEKNHGKVILTVSNKGDEIPEEKRQLLFERFYRLDDSRNSESNHYGLGLSIAKSIVDVHKGDISFDCKEGMIVVKISLKEIK